MPKSSEGKPETFINPVYPYSFPDPFVLKFRGEYFAYCTGKAADGNIFGVLHSRDLVDWTEAGSAMEPLASGPPFYWAPEVVYSSGKFYLYYSAGNEILMEIRVAVSDRPDGGFVDADVRLTKEEFAIDAHVFIDTDGSKYLFYATDFLEHSHVGTGTVVDRMIAWNKLEGKPRPVTRAKYDWQVYDPVRKEKGGVRWHTVEGPAVLKRKGKYFEMFSGGNWQNRSYGVSFAIADSIRSTVEWEQFSDGENILPILRTIPEKVIGPGHNSVIRGPNNRELYCVYHRWTDAGRVLSIDRMDFAGDRIFVGGPTTTEQPAPFRPRTGSDVVGKKTGKWSTDGDEFLSSSDERCELSIASGGDVFLLECTFRVVESAAAGSFGFRLNADDAVFEFSPGKKTAILRANGHASRKITLAREFDPFACHLLRIEVGLGKCKVVLDDASQAAEVKFDASDADLRFMTDYMRASISAIEITSGFEELFASEDGLPRVFNVSGAAVYGPNQVIVMPADDAAAELSFAASYCEFDFAANIALADAKTDSEYGLVIYDDDNKAAARLSAAPASREMIFQIGFDEVRIDLPEAYVGNELRQFRIVVTQDRTSANLDGFLLAELAGKFRAAKAAVFGNDAIAVEMIRYTEI